ncbi:MAG: 2-dehydro-3-deoxygalactonokinase [Opitutaceae bacterium]
MIPVRTCNVLSPSRTPESPDRTGGMHFFSGDWGTSRFRLRLVNASTLAVLASLETGEGVKAIHEACLRRGVDRDGREAVYWSVLRKAIARLARQACLSPAGIPAVVSGMASSSIGLRELPYARLPFALDGSQALAELLPSAVKARGAVLLVSGLRADAEVMRGEETQLIGAFGSVARLPARRVIVLPGTHSKHVVVERGQAVAFETYMTGELFDLLSRGSVLASSLAPAGTVDGTAVRRPFLEGVLAGRRENLLHAAFRVRARALLDRAAPAANRSFLSGVLIGAELRSLLRMRPRRIEIVGAPPLDRAYERALRASGFRGTIVRHSATEATIAGHRLIARRHGLLP